MLHMEVFNQRLRDEFGTAVLITSPTVPYKVCQRASQVLTHQSSLTYCLAVSRLSFHATQIVYKDGTEKIVNNLADWPDPATTPFYRVRSGWFRS